jgi:hypothetical protein
LVESYWGRPHLQRRIVGLDHDDELIRQKPTPQVVASFNALNDRSRGMIMSPLLSFVAALERPTQREQFIIVERAPVRWEVPHTAHGALAFEDQ